MSNSRRSSRRLANKKRVDYNEDDKQIVYIDLDQIEPLKNNLNEETVQITKDEKDQPFMENTSVNNNDKIQNNETSIKTVNITCITPQDTFSNSKMEDENIPGKFNRRTKVNKTKFQQAHKTLSDLKIAITSAKSTISSFETCLKNKNKSLYDDNVSINDNIDNNLMDIDETYVIDDDDDDSNSVMEYENDNSHNVENPLDIIQKEDSKHLELVNTTNDQEKKLRQQDLIEIDCQEPLEVQNPSVMQDNNSKHDINNESPIKRSKQPPRFTLKLSSDLKKALQPDLHISTPLEDTEIIVYDSVDSDFDNDNSIITVVEHKQNMMTTRKMRMTNEDLLLEESQNKSSVNSSFVQINDDDVSSQKRIIEEKDTSQIVCIDDEGESLKDQVSEKQDTPADNNGQQEQQDNTLITNMGSNFTSKNESKSQKDQNVTKDESEVRENNKDIKDLTSSDSLIAKKDDSTSNKLKVQKKNSVTKKKGKSATTVVKKVGIESSNVHKNQKSPIGSISNPSIELKSIKDQNSQGSYFTSAENPNLDDGELPFNKSTLNKKKASSKPTVKENLKNEKTNKANKTVENMTELTSSLSISNDSVGEVVPAKRPAADNSETSGDILGPLLEMLDGNRKKLMKSDMDREVKINETSPVREQSATNIPNLTDDPSNSRAETMNIPYSSMSAEEHRNFLQIESMVYHNPELVSKEQYDFYQNMLERVVNERKDFEQWQFERSKLLLGHLNKLIESKVMNHLKYGRHSNINNYSEVKLTIGLDPASIEEPELKFKQKLGSIGSCFEIIPPITNQIPISLEKELWLDDIGTVSEDSTIKDYWQKTRTPMVSQDPLIHTIISNHKVDIVISSGCLAALVGLAESTDVELEIPIKIVEITKENSTFKTIYIDKPFMKKQMTPREINQIYYNTAFESMALKMNTCSKDNTKTQNKGVELQYSSNNLEYSLWDIGGISILIRCKSNGYLKELNQKTRTVGIKTKLDYQLDYNYESITNIERSRWWIYSMIRNKADLMLGRINVLANTLCVIEKVPTEQILPDKSRVKLLNKKLHYVFKHLQSSLSQGSYILRHEKGEPYAAVYKSVETGHSINSLEIDSWHIDINSETIPFVPLVWKGTQAQITGTFPIRAEPIRTGSTRKKICYEFARSGKCNRKKCTYLHVQDSKIKSKKKKKQPDNNGGCDDLQYIADHVIEKNYDFDNIEELSGSSAPDFATLLNNFKK